MLVEEKKSNSNSWEAIINEKDKKIEELENKVEQFQNLVIKENSKTNNLNVKIKELEQELEKKNNLINTINVLKKENEKYITINNELNKQVNNEKEKNALLTKRIKQLDNEINKYKKNDHFQANLTQDQKMLNLYQKIDELKLQISRYPFELKEGEKMICVNFLSNDQEINNAIICKNTDKFSEIELKLYEVYPKYSEKELVFLKGGKKINRNKTLDDNNIHDHDKIICYECKF